MMNIIQNHVTVKPSTVICRALTAASVVRPDLKVIRALRDHRGGKEMPDAPDRKVTKVSLVLREIRVFLVNLVQEGREETPAR